MMPSVPSWETNDCASDTIGARTGGRAGESLVYDRARECEGPLTVLQDVGVRELLQQPAKAVLALGIGLGHEVFHVRMLAVDTVSIGPLDRYDAI